MISKNDTKNLIKYLEEKPKIIIISHANPDGDAIGSSLAIYQSLQALGIPCQIANIDGVPSSLAFIPGSQYIRKDFDPKEFDAVWFCDCGNKSLTKFHNTYPEILTDHLVKINIDHHPTNDFWGEINFVETNASSTAEIAYKLLNEIDPQVISPDIATALLTGIYTDTGGLMHQNTTPETYFTAANLIKKGASLSAITKNIFNSYDLKTLKLWSKVLENLHITEEGAAIVGIKKQDYEDLGANREDLQGVVDFINSMPEAEYCVLLSEDQKGNVKASLRTRKEDLDMKALAEQYGGGGHVKASGFTIPQGKLKKEITWKIIQQ